MRALLDVTVLIALLDADHSLHERAIGWFSAHARLGWASCPITQNGCVRVMSHRGYPNPVPATAVIQRLRLAAASGFHEFWPDDISLLDERVVVSALIHGRVSSPTSICSRCRFDMQGDSSPSTLPLPPMRFGAPERQASWCCNAAARPTVRTRRPSLLFSPRSPFSPPPWAAALRCPAR